MPVKGDFSGLSDLRRRMAAIGDGKLRLSIAKNCAEAGMKVLDDEFRSSTDPYGRPWAPLTSRIGQPLRDTGTHLQGSLSPKSSQTGFVISTSFKGAAVHQYGATIRAKPGKVLAFQVRGPNYASAMRAARRSGRPQSVAVLKRNTMRFLKSVTIPSRQYMPEGDVGARWAKGLNAAATKVVWNAMGRDF